MIFEDSAYNPRRDFCTHGDLSAMGSQRTLLLDIQNEMLSCLEANTDTDDLPKCTLRKQGYEDIRSQCKKCLMNFISCITKKCESHCTKPKMSIDDCEICAKTNKCSFDICTNPNYLFPT